MVHNRSLITKKVIAYSFKDLMKTQDFHKISIKDIMDHADYRRQTFYDHFPNKYELLNWIYDQELKETIEYFLNYEHWTKIIVRMLQYFKRNLFFYEKTLQLSEQYLFDQCFSKYFQKLIKIIVLENCSEKYSDSKLKINSLFYAYGFVGITKEWIFNHCKTSIDKMEEQLTSIIYTIIKNNTINN